jgi:hypothetical protein
MKENIRLNLSPPIVFAAALIGFIIYLVTNNFFVFLMSIFYAMVGVLLILLEARERNRAEVAAAR